jgi:hypothetical protein
MPITTGTEGELNDSAYLDIMRKWVALKQKLASGGFLTPVETEQYASLTDKVYYLEKAQPDRFKKLLDQTQQQLTDTGDGDGQPDLNSIFNNTISSTSRTTKQQTQATTVEYVDLPTPEEFLSDFQNAYNIHITGLVQTGALRPEVADFARSMLGEVFGEYLRKQTERLLQGEPLWKVVGVNPDEKLLGARPGEQTSQRTTGTESQSTTTSGTATGTPSTGAQSTTTSGTATGTPSTTAVGQAIESGGSESLTTNFDAESSLNETQALVQRNKLAAVPTLAPLDFLKDSASAQRLNLLYAGYKGTAQRSAQTAAGGDVGGVRRL